MKSKWTAVDLFSGCGGLSTGLESAGFSVVAAVENDHLAADCYKLNHPRTLVLQTDISNLSARALMQRLKLRPGELDLLAGCPPCQGFSTLRTLNGGRRIREPMNDLVFEFLRFAKVLRPKTLMMENVPGLFHDPRLKKFCRALSSLGYRWDCTVVDASEYGVPQRRRRMILLASRVGPSTFASKTRRPRTVRDAIAHLEAPGNSGDPLHDHAAHRTAQVQALIEKIPVDGGGRSSLPQRDQLACHKKTSGFKDVYGRMAWDRPAPTITGGCINPSKGRFLHPDQHRAITLREAALLQGFPRRYKFPLRRGTYPVAQMIGNAFPPQFAMRHAKELMKQLRLQERDSNH